MADIATNNHALWYRYYINKEFIIIVMFNAMSRQAQWTNDLPKTHRLYIWSCCHLWLRLCTTIGEIEVAENTTKARHIDSIEAINVAKGVQWIHQPSTVFSTKEVNWKEARDSWIIKKKTLHKIPFPLLMTSLKRNERKRSEGRKGEVKHTIGIIRVSFQRKKIGHWR